LPKCFFLHYFLFEQLDWRLYFAAAVVVLGWFWTLILLLLTKSRANFAIPPLTLFTLVDLCHKLLKRKQEMAEEFDDNGWISSITVERIVFQLVSTLFIGNNKHAWANQASLKWESAEVLSAPLDLMQAINSAILVPLYFSEPSDRSSFITPYGLNWFAAIGWKKQATDVLDLTSPTRTLCSTLPNLSLVIATKWWKQHFFIGYWNYFLNFFWRKWRSKLFVLAFADDFSTFSGA